MYLLAWPYFLGTWVFEQKGRGLSKTHRKGNCPKSTLSWANVWYTCKSCTLNLLPGKHSIFVLYVYAYAQSQEHTLSCVTHRGHKRCAVMRKFCPYVHGVSCDTDSYFKCLLITYWVSINRELLLHVNVYVLGLPVCPRMALWSLVFIALSNFVNLGLMCKQCGRREVCVKWCLFNSVSANGRVVSDRSWEISLLTFKSWEE